MLDHYLSVEHFPLWESLGAVGVVKDEACVPPAALLIAYIVQQASRRGARSLQPSRGCLIDRPLPRWRGALRLHARWQPQCHYSTGNHDHSKGGYEGRFIDQKSEGVKQGATVRNERPIRINTAFLGRGSLKLHCKSLFNSSNSTEI